MAIVRCLCSVQKVVPKCRRATEVSVRCSESVN